MRAAPAVLYNLRAAAQGPPDDFVGLPLWTNLSRLLAVLVIAWGLGSSSTRPRSGS